MQLAIRRIQTDGNLRRAAVTNHVCQRFLNDPIKMRRGGFTQSQGRLGIQMAVDLHSETLADPCRQPG